jgi:hypothetical protein
MESNAQVYRQLQQGERLTRRWDTNRDKVAVRKQATETNRQNQKRLESFHNGEIHEDKAHWNHDELTNAIRHIEESGHLMSLDEASIVSFIAAYFTTLSTETVAFTSTSGNKTARQLSRGCLNAFYQHI